MRTHTATTATVCVSNTYLYVFSYSHRVIRIDNWTYKLPRDKRNDTIEINLQYTIS